MSKPMDFWETHDCHSLKDIQDCALKNKFSCRHKPLLVVKLQNVVLDELHLMLRITGDLSLFNITNAIYIQVCFDLRNAIECSISYRYRASIVLIYFKRLTQTTVWFIRQKS